MVLGPGPLVTECRAYMGSLSSNKIDFSSPSEGFWEVGCSWEERKNFLWALLYVTVAMEMGSHVFIGSLAHLSLGLRLAIKRGGRVTFSSTSGILEQFLDTRTN